MDARPPPDSLTLFPGEPAIPPPAGHESWRSFWKSQGQPWRTEPEIPDDRKVELTQWYSETQWAGESGVEGKELGRADVEWLIAQRPDSPDRPAPGWTDDPSVAPDRRPVFLDLRGANLAGRMLLNLPLSCAQLTGANLEETHFERANLDGADLEAANLRRANLLGTSLRGANLARAHLEGAFFREAHLEAAPDTSASSLPAGPGGPDAQPEVKLPPPAVPSIVVTLKMGAEEEQVTLAFATAPTGVAASLVGAFLDSGTDLAGAVLGHGKWGCVSVGDVRWGNASLSDIDWSLVEVLGDDSASFGLPWYRLPRRLVPGRLTDGRDPYGSAIRANRQISVVLRDQGMSDIAARFAYRARCLERERFGARRNALPWLAQTILELVSGYGYRVRRCVGTYLTVVLSFAIAYYLVRHGVQFPWHRNGVRDSWRAIVFSVIAFHGRGLFPTGTTVGDPTSSLAALEAIIGLVIEISFIATFTQRAFRT